MHSERGKDRFFGGPLLRRRRRPRLKRNKNKHRSANANTQCMWARRFDTATQDGSAMNGQTRRDVHARLTSSDQFGGLANTDRRAAVEPDRGTARAVRSSLLASALTGFPSFCGVVCAVATFNAPTNGDRGCRSTLNDRKAHTSFVALAH